MYVIGDIHGQIDKATAALREAGLIDGDAGWAGGTATLWFMGDYFDRGPVSYTHLDVYKRQHLRLHKSKN